jgi:hypothetical protein
MRRPHISSDEIETGEFTIHTLAHLCRDVYFVSMQVCLGAEYLTTPRKGKHHHTFPYTMKSLIFTLSKICSIFIVA